MHVNVERHRFKAVEVILIRSTAIRAAADRTDTMAASAWARRSTHLIHDTPGALVAHPPF